MMKGWEDRRRNYAEMTEQFNEVFRVVIPEISRGTISQTIQRFEETGNVKACNLLSKMRILLCGKIVKNLKLKSSKLSVLI